MKDDQQKLEELYESIFDKIAGKFAAIKQGFQNNTEVYLNYWRTLTKDSLSAIDKYDRNVQLVVASMRAEPNSPAMATYEKIMMLKKFLVNQAVSPWKYEEFNCTSAPVKQSTKKTSSIKKPAVKTINDTKQATELSGYNEQFMREFNRLIENFEMKVEKNLESIEVPKNVERQVAGVINLKLHEIKKCFPQCPGYKR